MKRLTALLLLAPALLAQGVEAEKGTLRVAVKFEGKFAPADPAELRLETRHFRGPFEVEMVAEHGSWVNEGDVVVRFRRDTYDQQLAERTIAMELAEMRHRHFLANEKLDAERTARSLARAERDARRAEKKLRGFREFEIAFRDERERQAKQAREYGMENQKDELTQLEKMYSEDELVDATEEIVLKRARRRYAQAVAREELGERTRKYNKEWYEQWTEEDLVSNYEAQAAALEAAREKAAMEAESAKLELQKRNLDMEQARRVFEEFKAEGEKFVVRAPFRGLFMHGRGQWEKGARFRTDHQLGGEPRAVLVVGVVMQPGAMVLEGSIPESDILRVQPGLAVAVEPAVFEGKPMLGRLKVDYLPSGRGQFKARVEFDELPTGLRPGMTAKAEIILEEVRDAVLVPASAVKDGKIKVLSAGEGGEWREVVTGPSDGAKTVIREGLAPGEKVDPSP